MSCEPLKKLPRKRTSKPSPGMFAGDCCARTSTAKANTKVTASNSARTSAWTNRERMVMEIPHKAARAAAGQGISAAPRWKSIRRAQGLHMNFIAAADVERARLPVTSSDAMDNVTGRPPRSAHSVGPYVEGILTAGLATAVGAVINIYVGLANVSLIYVVPVLVAAVRHGLAPSLWVSGLSVLCFNFFLPPLYHFAIADPANVVALFFFMVVAIVASALGTRTRAQAEAARREAHT